MSNTEDPLSLEELGWEALSSSPERSKEFYGSVLADDAQMLLFTGARNRMRSDLSTPADRENRIEARGGVGAVAPCPPLLRFRSVRRLYVYRHHRTR
jgi:hypothetical protein